MLFSLVTEEENVFRTEFNMMASKLSPLQILANEKIHHVTLSELLFIQVAYFIVYCVSW
jgi:hypothetical protein